MAQETFRFLDELLDGGQHAEFDEEDEDPDIKNDPIQQMNLKEYLEGFIGNLATENAEGFKFLVSHLPPMEKKHLENYLKF